MPKKIRLKIINHYFLSEWVSVCVFPCFLLIRRKKVHVPRTAVRPFIYPSTDILLVQYGIIIIIIRGFIMAWNSKQEKTNKNWYNTRMMYGDEERILRKSYSLVVCCLKSKIHWRHFNMVSWEIFINESYLKREGI